MQTTDQEINGSQGIQDFWKAIGVDPNKTPDHITLGEIGIESMFVFKLQEEFNRVYSFKATLAHIKIISVKCLREYENGNTEYLRQFFDDMRCIQTNLTKYKYIIPIENYVRLNNNKTGKPVYFLAPFEITFSVYKQLAERMDRPVIGLNWTQSMKTLKSIEDLITHYSNILYELEPSGNYDLLGSFDGLYVIMDLLNKGLANTTVVIDVLSNNPKQDKVNSVEMLLDFLCCNCPDFFRNKLAQFANGEFKTKSSIRKIVQGIKEIVGRDLNATDMEEILEIAIKRAKLITVYQAQMFEKYEQNYPTKITKTNCKLSVIKSISTSQMRDVNKVIKDCRRAFSSENVRKIQ